VTVYDWTSEHQQAMARIGVFAELNMAEPGTPIYDAARRHTIQRVRESVDRGIGAILWGVDTGEFGVAYGYDDDDQVLLVSGVASAGSDSGLTQGRTESPARQFELVTAPALRHLDISPLGLFGACSRRQCLTLASTRWQSTTSWPALP